MMNLENVKSVEEIAEFLTGTQPVVFEVLSHKDERYEWIRKTLYRFDYRKLKKKHRGMLVKLLCKVSGYSRQQVTRLISQYLKSNTVKRGQRTVNGLKRKYKDFTVTMAANTSIIRSQPF